jgi:hypothetical protein
MKEELKFFTAKNADHFAEVWKMESSIKTKNAKLLGLRFPISFFRMKDELNRKGITR